MVETAKSVVLCIDDDDDDEHLLMICKLIFGQEGYQVFAAPNGWGGIEIFRRDRIDDVILDYVMPGMGETRGETNP